MPEHDPHLYGGLVLPAHAVTFRRAIAVVAHPGATASGLTVVYRDGTTAYIARPAPGAVPTHDRTEPGA